MELIYRLLIMGCNMCNKKKSLNNQKTEGFDILSNNNNWIYTVIILIIIISLIYFLILRT